MFDCPRQIKGIRRRRAAWVHGAPLLSVAAAASGAFDLSVTRRHIRSWSISKNRYRIRIVFDWQQKIGVSVSAKNGILGLTLGPMLTSFVNFKVCRDSSRVGDNIRPRIPAEEWAFRRSNIGIRNAAVLPLPVLAIATTSLPSSSNGIVWKVSKISYIDQQCRAKWLNSFKPENTTIIIWNTAHKKCQKHYQ